MSPPQEPIHIDSASYSSSVEPHTKDGDFKLSDLVQSIHHVLGDEGLDSERIDAQKIIQLMEKYSSNSVDWNQYTLFDHSRAYTRNLIDDGNGKVHSSTDNIGSGDKLTFLSANLVQSDDFSLEQRSKKVGKINHIPACRLSSLNMRYLSLSPIHDHSGSHCVMKILDGELQETLFNWPASGEQQDEVPVCADITESSAASVSNCTDQHLNGKPLAISKNTVYQPNQVTYVHGKGHHRLVNNSVR